MAYATTEELAEYLSVDEQDLPNDSDRLLDRASEIVDYYTMGRIDNTDTEQSEAAKKATMAQVEQWIEVGDEGIIKVQGLTIGDFQVQFGAGGNRTMPELASRARKYLFLAGLLHRGVSMQ